MIAANLHDDYDTPPDVPLISGSLPKKKKKDNMFDAITSAAEAFAKTVSTSTSNYNNPTPASNSVTVPNISPAKVIDLRMKNYEQLYKVGTPVV